MTHLTRSLDDLNEAKDILVDFFNKLSKYTMALLSIKPEQKIKFIHYKTLYINPSGLHSTFGTFYVLIPYITLKCVL